MAPRLGGVVGRDMAKIEMCDAVLKLLATKMDDALIHSIVIAEAAPTRSPSGIKHCKKGVAKASNRKWIEV